MYVFFFILRPSSVELLTCCKATIPTNYVGLVPGFFLYLASCLSSWLTTYSHVLWPHSLDFEICCVQVMHYNCIDFKFNLQL